MNELELYDELEQKRSEYKTKYDAYPEKKMASGETAKDIPANDVEGLRTLMAEIDDLGKKYDEARHARELREGISEHDEQKSKPANRLGGQLKGRGQSKDLADRLFETEAFKNRSRGEFKDTPVLGDDSDFTEVKNLFLTTDGYSPEVLRDGRVVPAITRPPQLVDFLRMEPHSQNAIKHMRQTIAAAQASAKGEGQALSEARIKYIEVDTPIRKIGVYIPVTEEQMEDEAGVRSLIESDLRRDVRVEFDRQITVGDGTGNNILGLYNATSALTQARGSDEEFDQVLKAINKARVDGRVRPNIIVMHSTNSTYLAMKKTSDGVYILGHPAEAPLSRVWGLQIVNSEALTLGTGMVVDTDFFRAKIRKDLTLGVSDSHAEYFIQNTTALRLHMRAGLQIDRDESIVKLTSLRSS